MVFCNHCSAENHEVAKFCYSCRSPIPERFIKNGTNGGSNVQTERKTNLPLTFNQFYNKKSSDRVSKFGPGKRKRASQIDNRNTNEAYITAGILRDNNGTLKPERGSHIPVKVDVNAGPFDVKKAAYDKIKRYNPDFAAIDASSCKLVYKCGTRVQYLPGTNIPFTVKKYKEDLGVSYSKVALYLFEYDSLVDQWHSEDVTDVTDFSESAFGSRYSYIK